MTPGVKAPKTGDVSGDPINLTLREWLRVNMLTLGWSIDDLARASGVGYRTARLVLQGRTRPRVATQKVLVDAVREGGQAPTSPYQFLPEPDDPEAKPITEEAEFIELSEMDERPED